MNQFNDAKSAFDNGYNCAQSVLTPFIKQLDFDVNTVLKLSSGFGAGMGRTQETCGAVTGAYMVLGLKYGDIDMDDEAKEKGDERIQEFTKRFEEKHGSTNCGNLLHVDLKTEEGQIAFERKNLHDTVCTKCIGTSVSLLQEIIQEEDQ